MVATMDAVSYNNKNTKHTEQKVWLCPQPHKRFAYKGRKNIILILQGKYKHTYIKKMIQSSHLQHCKMITMGPNFWWVQPISSSPSPMNWQAHISSDIQHQYAIWRTFDRLRVSYYGKYHFNGYTLNAGSIWRAGFTRGGPHKNWFQQAKLVLFSYSFHECGYNTHIWTNIFSQKYTCEKK